jgi:hypothetical protein
MSDVGDRKCIQNFCGTVKAVALKAEETTIMDVLNYVVRKKHE